MHAVFLDADTLGQWQDTEHQKAKVDLTPLTSCFDECKMYRLTSPEQRLERCQNADVIITNKVVIDRELMDQLPNLKAIQLAATGMNNIDLEATKEKGIQCFNVADYSTFAVAQLTLQFILNFATRASDHFNLTRQGAWQESRMFTLTDFPTMEVADKTLVLIGYGNIAQKVEELARAFGMHVLIANIPGRPMRDNQVPLNNALPQANFVSIHCPLSKETTNLINKDFIELMKTGSYLINTARGPIINEQDLADALKSGKLGGAGLDVLSVEPPSPENPLLQDNVPNTFITPHIAWASHEAKIRLIEGMAENMRELVKKMSS